jgi:5-methylcytosine-specific restriction endonuclease McrA
MKFCEEPGCPKIAKTGQFCEDHQNISTRTVTVRPPSDPWYAKAAWRGKYGVRRYKLKKNPMCEKCGEPATQVHHLDDSWKVTRNWFIFMGGYDAQLLQSLCTRCHSEETMKQIKERGLEGLKCNAV